LGKETEKTELADKILKTTYDLSKIGSILVILGLFLLIIFFTRLYYFDSDLTKITFLMLIMIGLSYLGYKSIDNFYKIKEYEYFLKYFYDFQNKILIQKTANKQIKLETYLRLRKIVTDRYLVKL
jgi:hypothetical protein